VFQFFTRANDGMTTIADLKGKKVVTEFRAIAGFDSVIAATLGSANLTAADVDAQTVAGIVDAIGAVRDGRIDATMVALGIPPLREADAAIPGGIRVLTLGDNHDAVTDVVGLQVAEVAPSPAQVGIDKPIEAVSFNTFVNVGAGMSDDDAYELTKVVHENWAKVQEALPALRGMKSEWMVPQKLSHPFHPGAIRYFKEQGMWSEDLQAQQDALLAM
ncbi:MAG: TAXI family TRAP transporter solute-binding subunit, partial [Oricola sp.]